MDSKSVFTYAAAISAALSGWPVFALRGLRAMMSAAVSPVASRFTLNPKLKWICVENDSLITFAEVKRLVIYPMLLAQFVGIVHEIKPRFLRSPPPVGFDRYHHLPPALMALGHFSGNAAAIVRAYKGRGILICVAENFDVRIAAHRKGSCQSPLYWNDDAMETAVAPAPAISSAEV